MAATLVVAGCGGGGEVGVVVSAPLVSAGPAVGTLGIALTRVGPQAIQVDWSDDPYVAYYTVRRDGYALASVDANTLIDASVVLDASYCYRVEGYDSAGGLLDLSDVACVTVFP